jgi:hypothetical protein
MIETIRRLRITSFVELYLLVMALVIPWQDYKTIRGAGALTPFHLINVLFFSLFLVQFLLRGQKLRWPFAIPAFIYLLGSIIGMFNSLVLGWNLFTIAQDLYLYIWFVMMCVLLSSARRVEYLMTAWAISVLLILSSDLVAGLAGEGRFSFTFRNPNRAASYFALSAFFLLHPVVPRSLKVVVGAGALWAVSSTGSLGGLGMVAIGGVVFAWAWSFVRTPRALNPLQHLGFGIVAVGCLYLYAGNHWAEMNPTTTILAKVTPTGAPRMEEGTRDRELLWAAGFESFREHPLGIGPLSFKHQVGFEGEAKTLHSDFVASLVERGIVGFLGFLLFLCAVALMLIRMLRLCALRGDRERGFWAASLAGGYVAYVSYGITHEMLHHETFWLLLALIVSHMSLLERQPVAAFARVATRKTQRGVISAQSAQAVSRRRPAYK